MTFKATARVKSKINITASVKGSLTVAVTYPVLAASCPQYDLISGGTPSWNYVPIGSFDLVNGGQP